MKAPSKSACEQTTLADVERRAGTVHDVGMQRLERTHIPYAHLTVDAWHEEEEKVRVTAR